MEQNKKNMFSRSHDTASKKNIFQLANNLVNEFEKNPNVVNDILKALGKKESDFIEKN